MESPQMILNFSSFSAEQGKAHYDEVMKFLSNRFEVRTKNFIYSKNIENFVNNSKSISVEFLHSEIIGSESPVFINRKWLGYELLNNGNNYTISYFWSSRSFEKLAPDNKVDPVVFSVRLNSTQWEHQLDEYKENQRIIKATILKDKIGRL